MTPPCGVPWLTTLQEPFFQNTCLQPLVDHPSDNAVRHSLVEERSQLAMRDGVEILAYINIQNPVLTLPRDHFVQLTQRIVARSIRPETVRTRPKVLLVDSFQNHDDRSLGYLVFEGCEA